MPDVPVRPWWTNARAYYHYTRGCGCNGHPAFPTALWWADETCTNSGAMRGWECGGVCSKYRRAKLSARHRPRKRAIQYSEASVMKSKSCGRTGYSAFAEYDGFILSSATACAGRGLRWHAVHAPIRLKPLIFPGGLPLLGSTNPETKAQSNAPSSIAGSETNHGTLGYRASRSST